MKEFWRLKKKKKIRAEAKRLPQHSKLGRLRLRNHGGEKKYKVQKLGGGDGNGIDAWRYVKYQYYGHIVWRARVEAVVVEGNIVDLIPTDGF